jgi:hypothetical protein
VSSPEFTRDELVLLEAVLTLVVATPPAYRESLIRCIDAVPGVRGEPGDQLRGDQLLVKIRTALNSPSAPTVEHRDASGDIDRRSLTERALSANTAPSDKDDAIAIVVERLRLMHAKIQAANPNRHLPQALQGGPTHPSTWNPPGVEWKVLVAWTPILADYAFLVEKRLVALKQLEKERDEAVAEARRLGFQVSEEKSAFERRKAAIGPNLEQALRKALEVLAEPSPPGSSARDRLLAVHLTNEPSPPSTPPQDESSVPSVHP